MLFPAPGGPVMPMRVARPVLANKVEMSLRPISVWDSISVAALARARVSLDKSAPIRSRSEPVFRKLFFQKLTRNDEPLNLASAFTNRAQLYVAIELLDRIIFDESIAAVNLQGLIGHLHGHLRRK